MSTDAELAGAIEIDEKPFINSLNNASRHWHDFNAQLTKSDGFNNVAKSAVAMGTVIGNVATSVIQSITAMSTSALGIGVNFLKLKEQATIGFTSLLGSGEKAKVFLNELAAFANTTPFEFPELVRAAQKFTAMGFASKEVIPILTSVGNAVAAMGGNAEMVDRVTTALVQMKAKGKVSAQEMMQLAEAGIPAWEILANKIGVSIPAAMKLGEKGAISANVAIGALLEGMDKRFGGMMEKQSHSFQGLMSTISDTSRQALGSILEPLFKSATEAMQGFVNLLPSMQKGIEGMTDQVKLATVAFTGLALATGAAATAIAVTLGGPAALAVAGLGLQVAAVTAAILSNFGQIGSAIAAWTGDTQINFSTVLRWIGMGADGFAIFARSILQGVDIIGTALVVMGQSFKGVMGILQGFATSVKGVLTFDPTTIVTGISQMQGAWTNFDTGVSTQISALSQRIKTNLQSTVDNMNGKYASGFQSAGAKIGAAFTAASNKAGDFVKSLGEAGKQGNKHAEDAMGGKGAAKGAAAMKAAAKLALDSVNEMLDTLKAGVKISKDFWDRMTADTKVALTAQSIVIKQFTEALKNLNIARALAEPKAINVAIEDFRHLGDEVKRLEEAGIRVNIVYTQLADVLRISGDSAKYFAQTADAAIDEFFDNNKANLEAMTDGLKDMVKASGEAFKKHIEDWFEAGEAAKKWGKVMTDAVERTKDNIKNLLGDGIGGLLVSLGEKFNLNFSTIEGWAKDVESVIAVLPESFQRMADKILGTVDKWLKFGDGVLSMLNRLGFEVPNTMGDLIQAMVKKFDFSGILNKVKSFGSSFLSSLKSIFSSAAGMIAGGAALFGASFGVGGVGGKLLGAGGGALMGAKIGSMIAPGIGTAIGAIGGAIFGGLFGGKKSKEQQDAEKQAKEQAALQTQGLINSVNQGIIETMQKGADLLKSLAGYVEVPRKAILRFINQLGLVLTEFTEMSKQFKAESLAAGKAVVDNLGGAFEFLFGGAELINAIKSVETITSENIKAFISTVVNIAKEWGEAASTIELQTAKFTGKISDKLKTSFEFLGMIPDVIKGFSEFTTIPDYMLDEIFGTVQKIIQKVKQISEAERGLELNKAGSSAGIFATIFESLKGFVDFSAQLSAYKSIEQAVLDAVSTDMDRLLAWGDSLMAKALLGVSKFDALGDALSTLGASIRSATGGISALTGGGVGASVTYEGSGVQPRYGTYSGVYQKGTSAASAPASVTHQPITMNITLSLRDLEELATAPDRLKRLEQLLSRGGIGLQAISS